MSTWDDVLSLDGFTSNANRRLLNHAVSTMPQASILEVGSYRGSTAAAMCHDNDVTCIHLVDNHSEFGNNLDTLATVCREHGLPAVTHDVDWFGNLPPGLFGNTKFNVYFYDGPHEERHHAAELAVAWPHLADQFIYMVDDYSWDCVKKGCHAGLEAMAGRIRIVARNEYHSSKLNDADGYWNGLLIAWCVKVA